MRRLIETLLDAVAPRRCLGCGEVSEREWCSACGVPEPLPDAGDIGGIPLAVAGVYTGALARAITRFKYGPRPELAAPLARSLFAIARSLPLASDALWVPVPLHFERLVERGFNQSALLARELAHATGRPLSTRLLRRARDTGHQAALGRDDRARNVSEAFEVRTVRAGSVLLVDDVVTTGATAQACISALAEKGVRVQAVLALARTEAPAPAGDDAHNNQSPVGYCHTNTARVVVPMAQFGTKWHGNLVRHLGFLELSPRHGPC